MTGSEREYATPEVQCDSAHASLVTPPTPPRTVQVDQTATQSREEFPRSNEESGRVLSPNVPLLTQRQVKETLMTVQLVQLLCNCMNNVPIAHFFLCTYNAVMCILSKVLLYYPINMDTCI